MVRRAIETIKRIKKTSLSVLAAAVLLSGITAGAGMEAFAQQVERTAPGGQKTETPTTGNRINSTVLSPIPANSNPANLPQAGLPSASQGAGNADLIHGSGELKGVWISYLEWEKLPKGEAEFKRSVDAMMDNCVSWGLNAIFLHAHSHTDAMYPSQILPWSKFASGVQGISPGYDPFGYFVEAAHARGLQVHAWRSEERRVGKEC